MQLFHRIDDAECILRVKGGIYKQAELYRRGERVFVKVGGGYARVTAKFGDTWGTSAPAVNILEMPHDVPGLFHDRPGEAPRWTGGNGA